MIYLGICDDDPVYLKQAEDFLKRKMNLDIRIVNVKRKFNFTLN